MTHTIGLCMIAKNEAHVVERCLESVKTLVDYVLVEDTGSTDGTQQIVRDWLLREGLPGEVVEEPWRDFAFNRTHALECLRQVEGIEYALVMDADDQVVLNNEFDPVAFKAALSFDLYDLEVRHGGSRFRRPHLIRNGLPFCYKGVLHEFLQSPPDLDISREDADGLHIDARREGSRSRNPRKYHDDASTLERALETETDPFLISRYTFYLAQSYRDCGEREKALAAYLRRAELGYWREEVFESLYNAGNIMDRLGYPADDVLDVYRRASDAAPTRTEALHAAARYCRGTERFEQGFQLAKRGLSIPEPGGRLFVEQWIYEWGLLDELAVNGYWSGHYKEALEACIKLLAGTALPANHRERIAQNASASLEKLPAASDLGSAGRSNLVDQHPVTADRTLRSRLDGTPTVLMAILAKQKAEMLPLYLQCIEALEYAKKAIRLYVRTNNNTDATEAILRDWLDRVGDQYAGVEYDSSNVAEPVQDFAPHQWNPLRFSVLGRIRQHSLARALDSASDFYFTADVDNFIRPNTLRELVALNLPICAPLLRSIEPVRYYSNFHAEVDANGYYKDSDQYQWILNRWIRGLIEVPVVHTTYVIRRDVIEELSYLDATSRHEYVIFSDSARKHNVPQYLDNRQVYGYIAFASGDEQHVEKSIEIARSLLANARQTRSEPNSYPRVFSCFGLHGSGSTWMYNLAREVCRACDLPFVSVHRDSKANLPWDAPGRPLIIARTPNPMADFQTFIGETDEPFVITVRDPRDAVASFMQRFPNSLAKNFDEAREAIARSGESLVKVFEQRRGPVFRYEDGFVGAPETVDRVAALLGVELEPARRDDILLSLSPSAVRSKIKSLESAGKIRGEAVWDRETHWHAGHVGDGKVGKWREALTIEQAAEIVQRTESFCRTFGYEII